MPSPVNLQHKSAILIKTLRDALANPLNVTQQQYEYDWLAYYDSINEACDMYEKMHGQVTQIDGISQTTDLNDGLYLINTPNLQGQPFLEDMVIAAHDIYLLVKNIDDSQDVSRMTGSHHSMISLNRLYEKKQRTLILPFEIITVIKPKLLGNISLKYAYETNPLDPSFTHYMTPGSVMAVILDKDIRQSIGFVVHARQLANALDIDINKLNSLQYDTATALRMLKSRYNIDIDETVIDEITKFDSDVLSVDGQACIELHTQYFT